MDASLNIPDDAWVFSFKVNVWEGDEDGTESASVQLSFIQDCCGGKDNILYTCLGRHENGENKTPHHHFTIITKTEPSFTDKTKSDKIKRYIAKNAKEGLKIDRKCFGTSKVAQINLDRSKFEPLAYPLKEGLHYWESPNVLNRVFYKNLTGGTLTTLTDLGKDLYLKKLGEHERREKHEQKQKSAFDELFNFVKKKEPKSYEAVVETAQEYYLSLDIHERPTTTNFIENIKKIALEMRLLSFKELMRI